MSNCNIRAPRTTSVPKVEKSEHLLRRSCQNRSNNRETGLVGIDAHERAVLSTADRPENEIFPRIFRSELLWRATGEHRDRLRCDPNK